VVQVKSLKETGSIENYDGIILGAPLFMVHLHNDLLRFLSLNKKTLQEKPVALFVLGPVHDPHYEQEWKDSKAQLDKELAQDVLISS
jgi:menaquinone-dependent protoporphyrinogen oxidase